MGSKCLFCLLAVCVAAFPALMLFLPGGREWIVYVVAVVALVLLFMLYRSIVRPASVAMHGLELISEQDTNNRLTKVGEHNADKVVSLFNSLIDRLREERLRNIEQDSFLRLLVEASPMGVLILDFDGRASLVNDSMLRITGIGEASEVLGRRLDELPSDMAAKMADVPLGSNAILRRGDVRMWRCYHLNFVQKGFPRRFYLLESLTEEVMIAEREAYEKVIRIISHEVNNTMGGVRSVLDILHETAAEDDVRDVIESCDDRCGQLCSFISAYADVVRVPEPVKRPADLVRELRSMMPFLRGMTPGGIALELLVPDEELTVSLDIALMQQVVVNIVKNAVESITSGAGRIVISASRVGGGVCLEIANDGEPIDEEVSRRLFSPFFTTKKSGRGLGLTLIGEILRRHDARFSLLTGPDGITRFRIVF